MLNECNSFGKKKNLPMKLYFDILQQKCNTMSIKWNEMINGQVLKKNII